MASLPMVASGGGTIAQLTTGNTIGSTNTSYTYTASAECLLSVVWTVSYNSYGYRKITVNGTDILDDTTKGGFCDVVHLASGDVCVITLESSTKPATYGIALISA